MIEAIQEIKDSKTIGSKIYSENSDKNGEKSYSYFKFKTFFYSPIDKEELKFFCENFHIEEIFGPFTKFHYSIPRNNSYYSSLSVYSNRLNPENPNDTFFNTLNDEKANISTLLFHLIGAGAKKEADSNPDFYKNKKIKIHDDLVNIYELTDIFLKNYKIYKKWEEILQKNYSNEDFKDPEKCNEMLALAILALLNQDISDDLSKEFKDLDRYNLKLDRYNLRIAFIYLLRTIKNCNNQKRIKESFNCLSLKYGGDSLDEKSLNIDEFCKKFNPLARLIEVSSHYAAIDKNEYSLTYSISEEIRVVNALMLSLKKDDFNKKIKSNNAFEKISTLQKEINNNFSNVEEFKKVKSSVRDTFVERVISFDKSENNYFENEIEKSKPYNQKTYEMGEFRDFKRALVKRTLAPTMINSIFLSLNNHQKFLDIKNTFSEDEIAERINDLPNDSLYGLFNNIIVSLNYAYDNLGAEGYFDFIKKCSEADQRIPENVSFYIVDNFENVKDIVWHWLTDMA